MIKYVDVRASKEKRNPNSFILIHRTQLEWPPQLFPARFLPLLTFLFSLGSRREKRRFQPSVSSLSFISPLVCLSSSLDSFREVGSNRLCTSWLFCELSPWPLQQPCPGSRHPSCRPGQGRAGERCAGLHHALPSFGDSPDNLYILLAEAIC